MVLRKDQAYRFTARVMEGEEYKDDSLPCTPEGPDSIPGKVFDFVARNAESPLNPVHWMGGLGAVKRLRVLRDCTDRRASFLTLIAAVGKSDEQKDVYVIGQGRTITAHGSGELYLFSNDWPGGPGVSGASRFEDSKTYRNNHGRLVVGVEVIKP